MRLRHSIVFGSLGLVFLAGIGRPLASDPVRWKRSDGGNGHFYEVVRPEGGIRWTEAERAAEDRTAFGVSGHLVTVTSPEESEFIASAFSPLEATWIGLSDADAEGEFEWVTGEPFEFTNWGRGEPNNAGDEDFVSYTGAGGATWNDFQDTPTVFGVPFGYIVEYPLEDSPFRRGDANADRQLDVSDAIFQLRDLFTDPSGSSCQDALDTNDDGALDISDPVALLNWLFTGEFTPPPPFLECGPDSAPDGLDCERYAPCLGGTSA